MQTFWGDCLELGAAPAGLGARDTLRLEMGMPLYGHELSAERNAAESGFTWAIARDKQFVGAEVVLNEARSPQRLTGVRLEGRRAARQGDAVLDEAGREIGQVTSGSFAPSLGSAVALAYVDRNAATANSPVRVRAERQDLGGRLARPPFYEAGTARKSVEEFLTP